ncbi:MAG TPA: Xaa-Pro aminopeptidase [Jatrophihabitans sp.]|nr:Xaa-Pro aminopeptidase [Jatrophihabitans sp.]
MSGHTHESTSSRTPTGDTTVLAEEPQIEPGADEAPGTTSHDVPMPDHLRKAISIDWAPSPPMPHPAGPEVGPYAARRRAAVSAALPGTQVVVPAGAMKVRANDTEYAFRAASSFTWLTGETVADAVLVMTPTTGGHDSTLYVREYAQPGDVAYFTDRMHGAVWVGNVPSLDDTASVLGIRTRPLSALADDLRARGADDAAVLRGFDPTVDALLPASERDAQLAQLLDELRLVKDEWELGRLRFACEVTARGFADVARELPALVGADVRGERWLEGTFWRRARLEGNDVGYSSILASGRHATTLHWWRNHGAIQPGTLLLADMGVETDELYTADVTRTMPVDGQWTPAQLKVYRAVQEAQAAGIAEVKAGADFLAAHRAAMYVIADHLHSWGILPVSAEVSCADDPERPGAGLHRRYTLHGTSHMLGIDVHDCALAREENYREGTLNVGHVLTVEPGLYFQVNDRSVPDELRGIGVRIEDDVVVTDGEPVNLSAMLPRDADEVTAWMREVQNTAARP